MISKKSSEQIKHTIKRFTCMLNCLRFHCNAFIHSEKERKRKNEKECYSRKFSPTGHCGVLLTWLKKFWNTL